MGPGGIQQRDSVLLDDLDQGLIEFRQEVFLGGSKVFIRTDLNDQLNHIIPRRHLVAECMLPKMTVGSETRQQLEFLGSAHQHPLRRIRNPAKSEEKMTFQSFGPPYHTVIYKCSPLGYLFPSPWHSRCDICFKPKKKPEFLMVKRIYHILRRRWLPSLPFEAVLDEMDI